MRAAGADGEAPAAVAAIRRAEGEQAVAEVEQPQVVARQAEEAAAEAASLPGPVAARTAERVARAVAGTAEAAGDIPLPPFPVRARRKKGTLFSKAEHLSRTAGIPN